MEKISNKEIMGYTILKHEKDFSQFSGLYTILYLHSNSAIRITCSLSFNGIFLNFEKIYKQFIK